MTVGRRKKSKLQRSWIAIAAACGVAALAAGLATLWRVRQGGGNERRSGMDANKKASRRILEEIFGAGKYDLADELLQAKAIGHDPALPGPVLGPEGLKESARAYRAAFPDLKLTVEEVVGDGDLVAIRWSAHGTQKGELFGVAATGKQATVTGITIDRYTDGKLAESWTNWDTLGLLQQLGAVPTALQTA